MSSVAVIGGGITGLTAAYRLREKGHSVTLFEASNRTGGVIQTIREGKFLAECGPNSILETSPKITQLVTDLGLENRRLESNPDSENRFILRRGKPELMSGSPIGFLKSRLFSWRAKLRLMIEPLIKPSPADAEENLAEFVKRRLGQEFLDYAINPFVAGIYAGDPARLSVKQAFPKLHAVEQKYGSLILGQIRGAKERKRTGEVSKQNANKFSFDDGLQVITDSLRDHLGESVRLQTAVTKIEKCSEEGGVAITAGDKAERFDAILLAIPAYKLAELEFDGVGKKLSPLSEITYPPVASVVLGFRREDVAHPLNGFGTLNPEVEKVNTLGTIFSSTIFSDRAPENHVTMTSYLGGMRSPELARLSPEEIIDLTIEDLRAIYGVKGEPIFSRCFIFPKAIPQYEVGYGRFKDLMSQCEKDYPGVFLAGHCRDGISLGDSIVSGENVSDRIDDFLKHSES